MENRGPTMKGTFMKLEQSGVSLSIKLLETGFYSWGLDIKLKF